MVSNHPDEGVPRADQRRSDEAPFVNVTAIGAFAQKSEAVAVEFVLYSRELLIADKY